MRKKTPIYPENPILTAVTVFGTKWKMLVLRHLFERPWRFGELQQDLGVSQKVLADALRGLEADGLVNRTVYPEIPPRVEYSMTELALSLAPVRDALIEWGYRYIAYRQAADEEEAASEEAIEA